MGRTLVSWLLLMQLAPVVAFATEASFGIRLEIRAPVRVETLSTVGIAGNSVPGAVSSRRALPGAVKAVTVAADAGGRSTVSILPATQAPLDEGPATGYDLVTILVQ